jgi:hypothetical protein
VLIFLSHVMAWFFVKSLKLWTLPQIEICTSVV